MLRLLRENVWPSTVELFVCPCLNPQGFALNRRENATGVKGTLQIAHAFLGNLVILLYDSGQLPFASVIAVILMLGMLGGVAILKIITL